MDNNFPVTAVTVLTAEQMRNVDLYAINTLKIPSTKLMENAAFALYDGCLEFFKGNKGKIAILCGKGNNGGDGFCLADLLKKNGFSVKVITLMGGTLSPDAEYMKSRLDTDLIYNFNTAIDKNTVYDIIDSCDLAVDCIFGTGFTGVIDESFNELINRTNKKLVIACDIPSGAQSDDGKVKGICIKASKTITFVTYKPCHYLYPSKDYCGETEVKDIGIPQEAIEKQQPYIKLTTEDDLDRIIKRRLQNTHKSSYGSLQMVCGSELMTGAAYLAAQGALRSGVGLLYLSIDGKTREILQSRLSEPVFVKREAVTKATALLIGCGLGEDSILLRGFLKRGLPTVIDADGLNYLSQNMDILKGLNTQQLILTPHPLEMSRLCGLSVDEIEGDRINTARNFAVKKGLFLVLKGKHTLIVTPKGFVYLNTTGNAGLAKGGSGDVLAGIIAGFLAQGYSPEESAIIGVFLHGKAGDILKDEISEYGMLPSDLPLTVAKILRKYNG